MFHFLQSRSTYPQDFKDWILHQRVIIVLQKALKIKKKSILQNCRLTGLQDLEQTLIDNLILVSIKKKMLTVPKRLRKLYVQTSRVKGDLGLNPRLFQEKKTLISFICCQKISCLHHIQAAHKHFIYASKESWIPSPLFTNITMIYLPF